MGAILSSARSKEAYLHDQAQKARRDAIAALKADDPAEAARLEDVALRAEAAANATRAQLLKSIK